MTVEAADVAEWLRAEPGTIPSGQLERVLASAAGILSDEYDTAQAELDDPNRHDQALIMYAARLYQRKFSTNGVEAVAEWGALRVSVTDPDVHKLLARWELIRFG